MKLIIPVATTAVLLSIASVAEVSAQGADCNAEPLSAEDLAAGPDALNAALACLQQRIEALEGGGQGVAAAAPPSAPASLATATLFEGVELSLDYSSIVDKTQVLLEFSIVNNMAEPRLLMIDDHSSTVTLRGETETSDFDVQGFARCGRLGMNPGANGVTAKCFERATENHWTLMEPGRPYSFRIATDKSRRDIRAEAASITVRFMMHTGDDWTSQDVSFPNMPLS